jgi:hypothetical protein
MARSIRGVQCCQGCGRDTAGHYCSQCIGRPERDMRNVRGRKSRRTIVTHATSIPLEDDYGDESDANSVCQDNSLDRGRKVPGGDDED